MARTLLIWSGKDKNARRNLAFGLRTNTWGLKTAPVLPGPLPEFVIFGSDFSLGNVRASTQKWSAGTARLIVCEINVPHFMGSAPHWQDEHDVGAVLYPWRFGFSLIGEIAVAELSAVGPLGRSGASQLRLAAITSQPTVAVVDDGLVSLDTDAPRAPVLAADTLAEADDTGGRNAPASASQGRSNNAELNKVIEEYAVHLATRHMQSLGYPDVKELGKPYDLVCRTSDGSEKHVEVKGTTGAGAEVLLTPNEVLHFRCCPLGAALVVVSDIAIRSGPTGYVASKGNLHFVDAYRAPEADLRPVSWQARVPRSQVK